MAKSIELKAVRLRDLSVFIGSLGPQEISDAIANEPMKAISRLPKVLDETIEPADKAFTDFLKNVVEPKNKEIVEKYQKILDGINQDDKLTDEMKQAKRRPVLAEAEKEINNLREECKVKEAEETVVKLEFKSDEKFVLVKTLFEKLGMKKFSGGVGTRAMAEIGDALDTAKEV